MKGINRLLHEMYASVEDKTEVFRKKCESIYAENYPDSENWFPCQYFSCSDGYENSAIKLMAIGQETNDGIKSRS